MRVCVSLLPTFAVRSEAALLDSAFARPTAQTRRVKAQGACNKGWGGVITTGVIEFIGSGIRLNSKVQAFVQ